MPDSIRYKDRSEEWKIASRKYQRERKNRLVGDAAANRLFKYNLRNRFGLSLEQYEKMHTDQKGLCAICRKAETAIATGKQKGIKRLSIDHNHKTSHIRGLLCNRCNAGIGLFNDSIAQLQDAILYLAKSHGNT